MVIYVGYMGHAVALAVVALHQSVTHAVVFASSASWHE
jgi:hypothetical protein